VQAPICEQVEVKADIQFMTALRAKRNEEMRLQSLVEEMLHVVKSRAVVRLQSVWRSAVIRIRVRSRLKSRAVVRLQSSRRSYVLRKRVKSRAVVRLESAWRSYLRVKSRAVVRLQSAW
jgi:hypothetical protein